MGAHPDDYRLFFRQCGTVIDHVEDYYADLAAVFHWPPSEIDQLSYEDLLLFRDKARQRTEEPESDSSLLCALDKDPTNEDEPIHRYGHQG
nr:GpE family phage tail protein [Vibrio neptunius]